MVDDQSDICSSESAFQDEHSERYLHDESTSKVSEAVVEENGDVEQAKKDGGGREQHYDRTRIKTLLLFLTIAALIVTIVVVLLAVLVPKGKGNNNKNSSKFNNSPAASSAPVSGDTPTPVPAAPKPTEPTTLIREDYLKTTVLAWSTLEDIQLESSSASKALAWLTDEDPLFLGVDSSKKDIQQRFTAACLFFSTNGAFWWPDRRKLAEKAYLLNFLSEKPVCDWNQDGQGILCDADGTITELQFGRFFS